MPKLYGNFSLRYSQAMTWLHALFLGVLQGVAEFLPVSSSGHLKLCQALFGFEHLETYALFDVVLHLGTLGAILLVLRHDLIAMLTTMRSKLICVIIATLPLFPCVLLLKPIKAAMNTPEYLGFFFIATAFILYVGDRWARHLSKEATPRESLYVGLAQIFALFPGISRSGTTISAMRLLGWEEMEAKKFTFFMAIPAVLGSVALELLQIALGKVEVATLPVSTYLIGFVAAFACGIGSLFFFLYVLKLAWFRYISFYLLALGLCALALLTF